MWTILRHKQLFDQLSTWIIKAAGEYPLSYDSAHRCFPRLTLTSAWPMSVLSIVHSCCDFLVVRSISHPTGDDIV